ncbi:MAG: 3-deoxy-manno-octulosonate cytidylyltransferase [Ignavibacteria bacterium]|nr:3-deoxy-manno-octulosonate cytidylyltransferase [Ignavibacteria bacterium]
MIFGIIPARYQSKRLPGKPLIKIGGISMVQRVYQQTEKSKYISEIFVATDDKRILNEVINFGGNAVMTLKKHKSGTDRIAEVVKSKKCDIVVNIQCDEPFIDPKIIDKAIEPLTDDNTLNVSTLAIKFTNIQDLYDEGNVKVVFDKDYNALYFSRAVIPFIRTDSHNNLKKLKTIPKDKRFYKHIGLYVYSKRFLLKFAKMKESYLEKTEKLEQLRILENGERIRVVLTNKDSLSIDTKDDLKKIKTLLKH